MFLACRNLALDIDQSKDSFEFLQDKFGMDLTSIGEIYTNNMDSFETLYTTSSTVSLSVLTDSSLTTTETLSIEEYKTVLKSNTYTSCTMGVTRYENGRSYLGALISTFGIIALELNSEKFTNIGAFTQEFFNFVRED